MTIHGSIMGLSHTNTILNYVHSHEFFVPKFTFGEKIAVFRPELTGNQATALLTERAIKGL